MREKPENIPCDIKAGRGKNAHSPFDTSKLPDNNGRY